MIRANRRRKKRPYSVVWDEPGPKGKAIPVPVYKMREGETPMQFANRKDRMEQIAANRAREREQMTRDEIERRIVEKLIECGKAARAVTESDIRGLNVPMKEVTRAMMSRCLARAEQDFPELRDRLMAA